MKRTVLYIYIFIIGFLFTACHKETGNNGALAKEVTEVRILATVNTETSSSLAKTTRASGIVNEDTSDYQEGIEDGNTNENVVGTIRAIAFDLSLGNVVNNILYRAPGQPILGDEKNFEFIGGIMTQIQLDMKILTGAYKFVLIANEEAIWNLESITTYEDLKNTTFLNGFQNPIELEEDLVAKITKHSGIPMIGEVTLDIHSNPNATEDSPQVVIPKIPLKRTISKVEVNIRNTDDKDEVFESARLFQITKATLINGKQKYNVFEGNNSPITETAGNVINNVSHTRGEAFIGNIFTGYIAERKDVDASDATAVAIAVDGNGQEFLYNLPIFQYKADGTTKNYDINRNTIYKIGTLLKGRVLIFELKIFTVVDGWKTETIEAIELPHEDYLNVDKRTIYLGTTAVGNHSEQINYFSNLDYISFEAEDIAGLTIANATSGTQKYLKITTPRNSIPLGESKSLKLIFGKNGKKILDITILVKAINKP